jgi:outer membrane protein
MKTTILYSFVLLIVLFGFFDQAKAQKFGYVNSSAILAEMPEVRVAESDLEALQTNLQKKRQGMFESLQKDYAIIQQKVENGELSRVQQEQESKKFQERQQEIANFEQEMVSRVQEKRQELLEPIYTKINDAIAAVAKENGLEFILEKSTLLYVSEKLNMESQVKAKLGL